MVSINFKDELLKKKMAYPCEYFTIDHFQQSLNLTKGDL